MTVKIEREDKSVLTTERKICCALDEQLGRSMLARPIGRQVVDKKGNLFNRALKTS